MKREKRSLEEIVAELRDEGLLAQDADSNVGELLQQLRSVQPWYVRTMVGLGAWLASLLVIGFFAGFGFAMGGNLVVGLLLIVAAVAVRRKSDNDFMIQSALATSLAGQAILAFAIAQLNPGIDEKVLCTVVIIISIVLFFVFPDRIHRVLSVLFAASALTMLVYFYELNAFVPVLGPLFAAALVQLEQKRARVTAKGYGHFVRPLENGLMLSAFGCLLLSTVYVLPELHTDFVFYPRPWISTILLGALFIYVGYLALPPLLAGADRIAAPAVYGMMLLVIACAWSAPGLLLALVTVMLGAATGNRSFVGAGIAFLGIFVAVYFYGIEVTMLAKSITLAAVGMAVLIARWLLLTLIAPEKGDVQHG